MELEIRRAGMATLIMQSATAEMFNAHGVARRTFQINDVVMTHSHAKTTTVLRVLSAH